MTHKACTFHLKDNITTVGKKAGGQFFDKCIYAHSEVEFNDIAESLLFQASVATRNYINNSIIPSKHLWVHYLNNNNLNGIHTSQLSKTFYGALFNSSDRKYLPPCYSISSIYEWYIEKVSKDFEKYKN